MVVMNFIHACKRAFGVFFITCKKKKKKRPCLAFLYSSYFFFSLLHYTPCCCSSTGYEEREIVKNGESRRERVMSPKEVLRIIKAMIQGRRIIRTCSPLSCRLLQCYYVCFVFFFFHFQK